MPDSRDLLSVPGEPEVQPLELTATHWLAARAYVGLLVLAALWFTMRPGPLGWDWAAERCGGEGRLAAVGAGIALFVAAKTVFRVHQLRVRAAETTEALNQLLYGTDYARDREAIDILIHALVGADPATTETVTKHLRRLTGQHFAADPKVWAAWWAAHRRQHRRPAEGGAESVNAAVDGAEES